MAVRQAWQESVQPLALDLLLALAVLAQLPLAAPLVVTVVRYWLSCGGVKGWITADEVQLECICSHAIDALQSFTRKARRGQLQ